MEMQKRIKNALLMMTALIIGLIIYTLFRPNTYISRIVASVFPVNSLQELFGSQECPFIRFYFLDLLWSFSLSCGLMAIFKPEVKGKLCCGAASLLCGVLWEVGQCFDFFEGTGDLWDIFMYLLGAILCLLINIKEKRYEKV